MDKLLANMLKAAVDKELEKKAQKLAREYIASTEARKKRNEITDRALEIIDEVLGKDTHN
tara:strand:+ start:335 stop:514 length:180 start_codon:yes stop_codon:yes gene_type:complete